MNPPERRTTARIRAASSLPSIGRVITSSAPMSSRRARSRGAIWRAMAIIGSRLPEARRRRTNSVQGGSIMEVLNITASNA